MTEKELQPNDKEALDTDNAAETETVQETEISAESSPKTEGNTPEIQKQLEEARNKYLYLLSDFENYKRNAGKERLELIQTAGRDVLSALLPVLDDFERAAKTTGLPEGIDLIYHKLFSTLQSKGLKKIELKAGDDFNADFQEAIAEIPAPNESAKGKIIDIVESGYTLADKIIRFAKVVVGK